LLPVLLIQPGQSPQIGITHQTAWKLLEAELVAVTLEMDMEMAAEAAVLTP
jgi:hypothetical protein